MVSQPPKIDSYTTNCADDPPNTVTKVINRPLPQSVTPKSSSAYKSPLRITILTNPERTRTRSLPPPKETHPSPICQAPPPPRITILTNPARTRSLPSVQNTPLPSAREAPPSPPRITILTNPARKRPSPPTEKNSQNAQNVSAATPAPKRVPTPISILKALAPSKLARPTLSLVPSISKLKERAKPLPKIVIHEPSSWDVWTHAHQPGTSYGELLDVPDVNACGKLYEEDFARFYPKGLAAEQYTRRLRKMVRSARRKERARKRRQLEAAASSSAPPTTPPPVISAPANGASVTTQTTGDSDTPECTSPEAFA